MKISKRTFKIVLTLQIICAIIFGILIIRGPAPPKGIDPKTKKLTENYNPPDVIPISKMKIGLLQQQITKQFIGMKPGKLQERLPGVKTTIKSDHAVVALTFDACDGKGLSGYDKKLIDYLKQNNIPATLFLSGKWIDNNLVNLVELSSSKLFDIENHGLNHKPLSVQGKSKYKIKGTNNIAEVVSEIEENARKIFYYTKREPIFFRSGTATYDNVAVKIVERLGYEVVNFEIAAGDTRNNVSKKRIIKNVLSKVRPGAIILFHMNRPKGNTYEAIKEIVPKLRDRGYKFVKLRNYELV